IRLVTCTLCGSSPLRVFTLLLSLLLSTRINPNTTPKGQCSEWFLFYTFRFARLAELLYAFLTCAGLILVQII
ncbi:hypothetical protein EDD16DRAFT_1659576, partial [Pisolithus croceorrhizus]